MPITAVIIDEVHVFLENPTREQIGGKPATLERVAARAEHVRAVVDLFPPLTPEQRDRIAVLLRPRAGTGTKASR